jgi:CheY-like chemotaxis protein
MRTLLEDGIDKAARGLTTLDEVLRVVSPGDATDRAAEAPPAAEPDAPPIVESTEAVPATTKGRVLVVEDSPTIVAVVKYFLELEGFDVLVAENGLIGLEVALRERPDVIVTDVNMPGMGGVAMVKAIRADARMAQVRILMLTSESSVESETEGLAAGADDYILKPVEPRRLAARVKALRARSRPAA